MATSIRLDDNLKGHVQSLASAKQRSAHWVTSDRHGGRGSRPRAVPYFLEPKAPQAARRAAQAIRRQFALLETMPEIGRPYPDTPALRERLIMFGDSGHVALHRYVPEDDAVHMLAFRHQKEAGH